MAKFPPITRTIWWAYNTGRLPKEVFDELLLEHHLEVCPTCRDERAAALASLDYDETFRRLEATAGRVTAEVARERKEAEAVYAELLAPHEADRMAPAAARGSRFRSVALIELILEKSFAAFPENPREAEYLASVAEVAIRRHHPDKRSLLVRALAHQANAQRSGGRIREARSRFREARELLRTGEHPLLDLEIYALLDWWEGVLANETRDFEEAETLLNRAAFLYGIEREEAILDRVLLSLSGLYYKMGNIEDALDVVGRVLTHLEEAADPHLYWLARFNRSVYLTEAGSYDEAKRELAECFEARPFSESNFLSRRGRWIQGRIAAGEGDYVAAERHLRATRDAFLADMSGINAALVSLDLALVCLQTGQSRKLRALAEEMVLVFGNADIHREAMAALMLFQEAVRQDAITLREIRRLRRYLEDARNNPALAFQRPS